MKKAFASMYIRVLALLFGMILGLGSFSALQAQYTELYFTDFTDWTLEEFSGSSGTVRSFDVGGAGNGFQADGNPKVYPAGTTCAQTGYFIHGNDGFTFRFPSYTFGAGGTLVVGVCHTGTTSNRTMSLTVDGSATGITPEFTVEPTMSTPTSVSTNVANFGVCSSANSIYEVTYTLAPTITGAKSLVLTLSSKSLNIIYLQVKSLTDPLVVSTDNTAECADDPDGKTIQATKGGSAVVDSLHIKGYNITGNVTMSITGTDAALFSLPVSSISNAEGLAGDSVAVRFTPSVVSGISNAQLIISSTGAPDYCVSLTGVTATNANPEITTPAETMKFATSLIDTVTQTIDISGINLTGAITLALSGADAVQFSLSATSVSSADALAGKSITVTYLGGIAAPITHNASLVLSSSGATDVTLPLEGLTYSSAPTMYSLTTGVTPGGTGVVTQDLGGSSFASGTTVELTALPQTGYRFKQWSDGNMSPTRSIIITSNLNLTAEFELGASLASPFLAYTPATITNTAFTARWSTVAGGPNYTVTVYDEDGAVVTTAGPTAGVSISVTGLTQGTVYTYKVETDTGYETNVAGPIKTTGTSAVPACGTP